MVKPKTNLKRGRLIDLVLYDPITGKFVWRHSVKGHIKQGEPAGSIDPRGYWSMRIDNEWYAGHRLAWLWVYGRWPSGEIDHINMNRADNRIDNLREATRSQNLHNGPARSHNSHGTKGITKLKYNGKWNGRWVAQIQRNKKQHYLGTFATAEEAHQAYRAAAEKFYGQFARSK